MNRIAQYIDGELELDALTDAEKCAICAAMEGRYITDVAEVLKRRISYVCEISPDYLRDGTACLRLVERFALKLDRSYQKHEPAWIAGLHNETMWAFGDTPTAAIVACVCALARAQHGAKAGA